MTDEKTEPQQQQQDLRALDIALAKLYGYECHKYGYRQPREDGSTLIEGETYILLHPTDTERPWVFGGLGGMFMTQGNLTEESAWQEQCPKFTTDAKAFNTLLFGIAREGFCLTTRLTRDVSRPKGADGTHPLVFSARFYYNYPGDEAREFDERGDIENPADGLPIACRAIRRGLELWSELSRTWNPDGTPVATVATAEAVT